MSINMTMVGKNPRFPLFLWKRLIDNLIRVCGEDAVLFTYSGVDSVELLVYDGERNQERKLEMYRFESWLAGNPDVMYRK